MPFLPVPVTQMSPPATQPQANWVPVTQASPPSSQPQMQPVVVTQMFSLPT
jgi:hypothetical protein